MKNNFIFSKTNKNKEFEIIIFSFNYLSTKLMEHIKDYIIFLKYYLIFMENY